MSDCVSTTVVLVATIVGYYTDVQIDGFCGIAVGILIFVAGINAAKETLSPLLGEAPDPEFVNQIEEMVLRCYQGPVFARVDEIVFKPGVTNHFLPLIEDGIFERI